MMMTVTLFNKKLSRLQNIIPALQMTIKLRRLQACLVGWQSPLQNNFTQDMILSDWKTDNNTITITISLSLSTVEQFHLWTRPQWTGLYHPKIVIKLKLSTVLNSAEPRDSFWGLGQCNTLYYIIYTMVYIIQWIVFGDWEHSVYHMYSGVYYTVYNPPLPAEDDNQPKPVCSSRPRHQTCLLLQTWPWVAPPQNGLNFVTSSWSQITIKLYQSAGMSDAAYYTEY